jgi:hypothetical protein
MVRANFRMRWYARADKLSWLIAARHQWNKWHKNSKKGYYPEKSGKPSKQELY